MIRHTCAIACVLLVASVHADTPEQSEGTAEMAASSLFGLNNVIDVHFEQEQAEWDKMQPPEDAKLGFLDTLYAFEDMGADSAKGRPFWSEQSNRPGLAGYLGVDHQYGKADVTIDGETVPGVGLRYKGNGTFLEGSSRGKFSYKVDFHEYDEDLEFRGLTKINFNNAVSDPSMIREPLSYELFREAGIPCSRVGYANLTMTVPGRMEQQSLGLYLVIEQVDKRFLKNRYGSAKGLLLKPSMFGVFRYLGEDWTAYLNAYNPKTRPSVAQQQRVIAFARLLEQADDTTFDQQVDEYLDCNQFLRFLAMNVLLCNLDSMLGNTQNYYVYLEPTTNKFQMLPWDMDHSFGVYPLAGTPESRSRLSIDCPGGPKHKLIERVLAIPRHKQAYHAYLEEYLETVFAEDKLLEQISETAQFVDSLSRAGDSRLPLRMMKTFVHDRRESVRYQLDGHSRGEIVQTGEISEILPFRNIVRLTVAFLALWLLNAVGWLWGVIAGFRDSRRWGLLNMFLYPIAPAIYGFSVRRPLGRRCAIWVSSCFAGCLAWIVALFTIL